LASLLLTLIAGVARNLLSADNRLGDPASLVLIAVSPKSHPAALPVRPDTYELWANNASSFESMAAEVSQTFVLSAKLTSKALEQPVTVALVTPNYFSTLGIRPIWGRTFLSSTHANGGVEAVISQSLWQGAFAADKGVLGKSITINQRMYSIAGVAPDSYPAGAQVWLDCPLELSRVLDSKLLITNYYTVWGRLRNGVRRFQAEAELDSLPHETTGIQEPWKPAINSPAEALISRNVVTVRMILLAGISVFLISCGNAGVILLLRALSRQRDNALRYMLGSTRRRMIAMALSESLGLASVVALLVIGLIPVTRQVFLKLLPQELAVQGLAINSSMVAITLLISTICVVCPTLLTLRVVLRQSHANLLHDDPNFVTAGARAIHSRGLMLACQVSIAAALTVVALLLFKSAQSITTKVLALDPHQCVVIRENLMGDRLGDSDGQVRYLQTVFEQLHKTTGVRSVGASTFLPLNDGHYVVSLHVSPAPDTSSSGTIAAEQMSIAGDYFAAAGTVLLRGRPFDSIDNSNSEPVIIVDEALARQIDKEANALGRMIEVEGVKRKIVGICGSAQFRGFKNGSAPLVYIPLTQSRLALPFVIIVARLDYVVPEILHQMQRDVEALDKSAVIKSVELVESVVANALHLQTVTFYAASVLASIGFVLSLVGISAVAAYSIKSRRHEIGIRLALGATPGWIIHTVLRTSLLYVAFGIIAGLALANWISHQLSVLIYGVRPFDGVIYLGVSGLLVISIASVIFIEGRTLVTNRILSLLHSE
jgi:predicted permease